MDVPPVAKKKDVGDRVIVDCVAVSLRFRVERGVKRLRLVFGVQNTNVTRETGVECALDRRG